MKDMMVNTTDDDDEDNDDDDDDGDNFNQHNYVFYSKPFFSLWRCEWDNETDVGWIVDLYRKLT